MKKFAFCTVVMTLFSLAGGQALEAQQSGIGGILDWIHRLSGPRMVGPAATGWVSLGDVPRLRMSVARRWSVHTDDSPLPDDKEITMWSFQPTIDFRLSDPLALGGGIAVHRFGGDFDDPVTHFSFPVYAQIRFPTGSGVQGVVSLGGHYFPEFGQTDFNPTPTGVSKDGGEFTFWFGVGFEVVRR